MALINLRINSGDGDLSFAGGPTDSRFRLMRIIHFLRRFNTMRTGSVAVDSAAVQATGTITISGGSGTISATVNAVSVFSQAWATSDAATATALAAAINASGSPVVAGQVTAAAVGGVVTITAVVPGISGNTIAYSASGAGTSTGGTRLLGGTATTTTLLF